MRPHAIEVAIGPARQGGINSGSRRRHTGSPHQEALSAVELTAAVAFTRRGAETKLVLPGLAQQKHSQGSSWGEALSNATSWPLPAGAGT